VNNGGVSLLAPGGQPAPANWSGGQGMLAVRGRLDGATVQLEWSPDADTEPVPVGEPMLAADRLGDAFDVPAGLLRVRFTGRTPETYISADAFPVPRSML